MDVLRNYVPGILDVGNNMPVTVLPTAATRTMQMNESGTVVIATLGSGSQTFTLPAAANNGLFYTFICGHASGEILINSAGALDTFTIKASEGGAAVVTAAGTGIKNTGGTNAVGDMITLISDGVTGWYRLEESGTWGSQ